MFSRALGGRQASSDAPTWRSRLYRVEVILCMGFVLGVLAFVLTANSAAWSGSSAKDASANLRPAVSGQPVQLSIPALAHAAGAAASMPAAPAAVLYDQDNSPGNQGTNSQDFSDFPTHSDQGADDFPVPAGQSWQVTEVDLHGSVTAAQPGSFNVYFYMSVMSGTYAVPGQAVYTGTLEGYTVASGNYSIALSTPATLSGSATNYFVSIQAEMPFGQGNLWYWTDRTVQAASPAAWRNPGGGGGAPGCLNWDRRTFCMGDAAAPDQMFRLVGNVLGVVTPTPSAVAPTPTRTSTPTRTLTPANTPTNMPLPTNTPGGATATPVPTDTPCPLPFTDVDPYNPFYLYIRCLYCRGIIGGYSNPAECPTGAPCFHPYSYVSRGQIAKMISNAAGYTDAIPITRQTFTDVPPSSTFWLYVERAYAHGVIGGYTDPARCPTGIPCFLPGENVTRGQTAKFVSNAAGYSDIIPSDRQTFTDVPPSSTFWLYVERVYMHGIVNGYTTSPPCTTGIPCLLPGNSVTRGQTAKFISNAFFPDCHTPDYP